MLSEFLTETCSITRKNTTNTNGVITKNTISIYSNIECQIYNASGSLPVSNIGENTPNNFWKIIIDGSNDNVRKGDIVEINGVGKYQVERDPKKNTMISLGEDSIELYCKSV